MQYVIVILAVLLNLIVHEGAHAFAMRRLGVPLKEAGLGIPIPFLPHAAWMLRNGLRLTLHPLFIGAYVMATQEGEKIINDFPYYKKTFVAGAGVVSNIAFGCFIAAAWLVTQDAFLSAAAYLLVTAFLLRFIRLVSAYGVPLLSVIMATMLVLSVLSSSSSDGSNEARLVGPIGIGELTTRISSLDQAIQLAIVLSFAIGLINALPLHPLDGGHIVDAFLVKIAVPRWIQTMYARISFSLFILLIVLVWSSDISRL